MDTSILAGRNLSSSHHLLIFHVHKSVCRDVVATLGRFSVHDVHYAGGIVMVVWNARVAGQPSHHQQLIMFSHHDWRAIVALRVRLHERSHVCWGELVQRS